MQTVSIIIPFFQSERGILKRALRSVLSQNIPSDWLIEVIVVDDGSPSPADEEIAELEFKDPVRIKLFRQKNGGVARARNRGLDESNQDAALIAFLDSDDTWPPHHLAHAIGALEAGFDFYFTDNCRDGYHESHWRSPNMVKTAGFLNASPQKEGLLEIHKDQMINLVLSEIPCQTSTAVYKFGIHKELRFNEKIKKSGEDVLFFSSLLSNANRICFDLDSMIYCGRGINMYFSNFEWNNKNNLSIKIDILVAHRLIAKNIDLSIQNQQSNSECIATCRREVAFHMLRGIAKYPVRIPKEIAKFVRLDPGAAMMLPIDMARVALSYAFGTGRS
jgi:succinoglycan biosynthesis protein ExoW